MTFELHHIVDSKGTAVLQDTRRFGKQQVLVRQVHADMKQCCQIEDAVIKRQIQRAAVDELCGHSKIGAQSARGINEVRRQVDSGNRHAIAIRHESRRAADTAADVQNARARLQAHVDQAALLSRRSRRCETRPHI